MLGIEDKWVSWCYLLCILSAVLCVVYGAINWNRGDDSVTQEDVEWVKHEEKETQEL